MKTGGDLMNVLIAGAEGQLGRELEKQIQPLLGDVIDNIVLTDLANLDITDERKVFSRVIEDKPDVIINCAAYTDVDACEVHENLAFRVNAVGARNLSAAAYHVGAKIVQVSTDYVFDGEIRRPHREYDRINPQTRYGMSKALGEELVIGTNPRHFILRTSWLFGDGKNFIRTMLRLAKERQELHVVDDQIGSPTSTVDLVRCIIRLMQTESYGVYHGSSMGSCSWYHLTQRIFEIKGMNVKLTPISTEELGRPAKRPKYSVLENFMLELIGLNLFRSWEEGVKEYLEALGDVAYGAV
jgi:dTDP-4-dehydrorhamnose reductase